MTYLELCQKLIEKTSITGVLTTVVGRSGELLRAVNWVNEAWLDIQRDQSNWDWMREDFSFDTVANIDEYTPDTIGATNFRKWHRDTLRIYKKSLGLADEQFFTETDYQSFRNLYRYGLQTPRRPAEFAVKPKGSSLLIGPLPDDIYTIRGEYQRKATSMSANTDTPDMPEDFHWAIVHKARIKYAMYENAPEVLAEAQADYNAVIDQMAALHLENIDTGSPLA